MASSLVKKVEESFVKRTPDIRPGDTVKVHLRIVEGGKERIQIFEGVVVAVSGTGLGKMITVRKISYGIGVEKIFPINTPTIKKIDVVERGDVRRAKLYYMRKAVGKHSLDAGYSENFEMIEEKDEITEVSNEEKNTGDAEVEDSNVKEVKVEEPQTDDIEVEEPKAEAKVEEAKVEDPNTETVKDDPKDAPNDKQTSNETPHEEPAGTDSSDKDADAESAPADAK